MFEYKIQRAWDNYKDDFGLGRICIFIMGFNTLLFFLSGVSFGKFRPLVLIPLVVSFIFYFLRPKIIKKNHFFILVISMIPLILTIVFNYYLIGLFDKSFGGLKRYDDFFVQVDQYIWGNTPAIIIDQFLSPLGSLQVIIYDILMIAYNSYFFISLSGLVLYFNLLPKNLKYKVGRYYASVILFYQLNYLSYLLVPVTGPQYWLKDQFEASLPLSFIGQFLWNWINDAQGTFIDCFPSGHTGISVLVTIWMFKINHLYRYICLLLCTLIILATLALRYHYTLDLVFAFPLAYLSYKLAFLLFPTKVDPVDFRHR